MVRELVVAILAGVVQGVVEWLPVSSQGNLAVFLTVAGTSPEVALQLALFLQVGTTLSAATYYRSDIAAAARALPTWRPGTAFRGENAVTTFVVVACVATGLVGIPLYVYAVDLAGRLTGGAFVALIGALLILTGLLQIASESADGGRAAPTLPDACLVGALQGVAILPGVSRSGVTSGALLLRRYEAPEALRLSFLLSIPAGLGAAALTVAGAGGLPGVSPLAGGLALATSALAGYATVGALMEVVERIPFWLVCFGLGGLALVGGGAAALLA